MVEFAFFVILPACLLQDKSKAFDRVWHRGLLFKLRQHGIAGPLLKWISDYLSDRTQQVTVKSCVSSTMSVNAGVPQGSVLGPLLFFIYVNDIADSQSHKTFCRR